MFFLTFYYSSRETEFIPTLHLPTLIILILPTKIPRLLILRLESIQTEVGLDFHIPVFGGDCGVFVVVEGGVCVVIFV